jgi:hypothetical protein
MWSPKGLRKTTFEVQFRMTTLGAPLLVSTEKKTFLSRCSTESSTPGAYKEDYLQQLIDEQPDILPISDFIEDAKRVYSLGREVQVNGFSIDNVLVTDGGHLVLVETKLVRNPGAVREVVAQILDYAMGICALLPTTFENQLRRCKSRRLADDQTVSEYIRNLPGDHFVGLIEDFDETFEQRRRDGEILLLIVGDEIKKSAERLVGWMAKDGSGPHQLGMVELCLYDLPGGERIVIPKTLLRTREASRHVEAITMRGMVREQVTATVSLPDQRPETRKIASAGLPMTIDSLRKQVREKSSASAIVTVEDLIAGLNSRGFDTRGTPTSFQYGVTAKDDFVPLLSLSASYLWFQIPVRAVRLLGDDQFTLCKQRINKVANFYRPAEVMDPTKTNALNPKYDILEGKVLAFLIAMEEVAAIIRQTMTEAG